MSASIRAGGRVAIALALAAALLALPGWTSGAPAASCCGVDCTPCPLSFCKTTRADRALLPAVAALAAATEVAAAPVSFESSPIRPASHGPAGHEPRAFHPLRN